MTDLPITISRDELAEEIESATELARQSGETVETILAGRYIHVRKSIEAIIRREMEGVVIN